MKQPVIETFDSIQTWAAGYMAHLKQECLEPQRVIIVTTDPSAVSVGIVTQPSWDSRQAYAEVIHYQEQTRNELFSMSVTKGANTLVLEQAIHEAL